MVVVVAGFISFSTAFVHGVDLRAEIQDATEAQKSQIQLALKTLGERLDNERVLNCLGRAKRFQMSQNALERLELGGEKEVGLLLPLQMIKLLKEPSEVPALKIQISDKKMSGFGFAENDDVVVNPFLDVAPQGEFQIVLNAENPEFAHSQVLAGQILHLMVHAMGHDHPRNSLDLSFQTLMAEACLSTNGSFQPSEKVSLTPCALR